MKDHIQNINLINTVRLRFIKFPNWIVVLVLCALVASVYVYKTWNLHFDPSIFQQQVQRLQQTQAAEKKRFFSHYTASKENPLIGFVDAPLVKGAQFSAQLALLGRSINSAVWLQGVYIDNSEDFTRLIGTTISSHRLYQFMAELNQDKKLIGIPFGLVLFGSTIDKRKIQQKIINQVPLAKSIESSNKLIKGRSGLGIAPKVIRRTKKTKFHYLPFILQTRAVE